MKELIFWDPVRSFNLDVTKSEKEYKVGDVIGFKLGYGGMLKASTSPYVEKACFQVVIAINRELRASPAGLFY